MSINQKSDLLSLLYVVPVEWFELQQRFHHLASTLGEHFNLTVLAPRSHKRLWRERNFKEWVSPFSVTEQRGDFPGRVISVATSPFYRRHPALVRRQWARQPALFAAAVQGTPYDILLIADPSQAAIADLIPHRRLVYECVDDHAGFWSDAGLKAQIAAMEATLARRADVVIATSQVLADRLSSHNPRCVVVGNGVDLGYFTDAGPFARPADLPAPATIGFYGAVGSWVDCDLLASLARRRPDWTFVLIGPLQVAPGVFDGAPNLHLLGPRPYAALRGYLAHIPVWLVPFRQDPMTAAIDPLKAYEYLAAGRRVVATPLPALADLAAHLSFVTSPDAWEAAIANALASGLPAACEREQTRLTLASRDWPTLAGAVVDHLSALLPDS